MLRLRLRLRILIVLVTGLFGHSGRADIFSDDRIIRWPAIEGARSYKVDLSANSTFTPVLRTVTVDEPEYFWEGSQPGRYYMRVFALGEEVRSAPSLTSIVYIAWPRPVIIEPAPDATITRTGEAEPLVLSWQEYSGSLNFILYLARDAAFLQELREISLRRSRYVLTDPGPGTWYWKVGVRFAPYVPLRFSDVHQFTVKMQPVAETQPEEEPVRVAALTTTTLRGVSDSIYNELTTALGTGYVGIRYGGSLMREGDPLVTESTMMGIVWEKRGGLLSGLRFNYDLFPEINVEETAVSRRLWWQRFLLGWALEIDIPFIFNKIHAIPKVGRYSVELRTLRRNGVNELVQDDINMIGHFSLGYELDAEISIPWFLFRVWGGQNVSGSAIGVDTGTTIYSKRAGIDTIIDGFDLIDSRYHISFLGFVMFDSLEIAGTDELEGEDKEIELLLTTAFAGVGMTVVW